jgi:hypothetical protein
MHTFLILNDDIYTLDTAAEIAHARAHMLEAGIASLPMYVGEAGEEGTLTGSSLTADETEECEDNDCAGCAWCDEHGTTKELLTDAALCEMLMLLVNPESSEDDRTTIVEELTALGRVDVTDFRSAGVLTRNAGFVLRVGDHEFQITVVS